MDVSRIALIKSEISASISIKQRILRDDNFLTNVDCAVRMLTKCLQDGGRIYLAGNGGSAADAQHIAAEFVSRFAFDRPGLPAEALTTDSSILTAIGNDYGYEELFRRQVAAKILPKDVFIGMTTSGKSKNVIAAFQMCTQMNIHSIALTGQNGCFNCEPTLILNVPSTDTARIQECHILLGHLLCGFTEKQIFSPS